MRKMSGQDGEIKKIHFFLAKGRFFSRMEEQWKEEEKFLLRKKLSNGVYFGASLLIANFTLEMIELILCHFLFVATG